MGFTLGDLGSDVIKIENPEGGDAGRGMMQMSQMTSAKSGHLSRNFFFEAVNRNN